MRLMAGFAAVWLIGTLPAQTAPVGTEYKFPALPPMTNNYPIGADSKVQPGVPHGQTFDFDYTASKVFPNTTRRITVYVPAQYDARKPACLYVGLDGLSLDIATVLDNLIAQKALPVMIAIGVSPGRTEAAGGQDNPRLNRSFEFDSMDDRAAHLLLDEVLPEVERHTTPAGLPIRLSQDANDRMIAGASTGGIAAFNVAWQRPDAFRRVFSTIGTFVGMRGGEQFNVLVRKTEPKPIRVFYQDNVYDEWPGGPEMGDWWMAGQTIVRALEFAGYDVRHLYGLGGHNTAQAKQALPDAMRWLWHDWPKAIISGTPGNPRLAEIVLAGEAWTQVPGALCAGNVSLIAGAAGEVTCRPGYEAAGPDGTIYRAVESGGVGVFSGGVQRATLAPALNVRALTVRHDGSLYVVNREGELWLVRVGGEAVYLDNGIKGAAGLAFSPDGAWLVVPQSDSRRAVSFRVKPDGTLDAREPSYDLYVPLTADDSGASGIVMDGEGRAYTATRLGVQVSDRNGRVESILPLPGGAPATAVTWGGRAFDTLYVVSGATVYKRKMKVPGVPGWAAPIVMKAGSAG